MTNQNLIEAAGLSRLDPIAGLRAEEAQSGSLEGGYASGSFEANITLFASSIDNAVQLHGARGVARGEPVERLHREIRALRIYEGATEVQKLIIGRELLRPPAA